MNLKPRSAPARDEDAGDGDDFVRGSKFNKDSEKKSDDSPKGREGMFGTARGGRRDDDEKSDSGNWRGGGGGARGARGGDRDDDRGGRSMFGSSRGGGDDKKPAGKYVPLALRGGRGGDDSGSESGFRRGGGRGGEDDRFGDLRRGTDSRAKREDKKPASPGDDFAEEDVDGFAMITNKKGKSKFDAVLNEDGPKELKSKNKFGGLDSDEEDSSKEERSESGEANDDASESGETVIVL